MAKKSDGKLPPRRRVKQPHPQKFWDSKEMRDAAYKWAKYHDLDWNDQTVKEELRESYRKRWNITANPDGTCADQPVAEYKPTKKTRQTVKRKELSKTLEPLSQNEPIKKDSEEENAVKKAAKTPQSPPKLPENDDTESEFKPAITHRKWQGEHWNGTNWEMPPSPRTDYFAWYNEFIQPHFGPNADPLGQCHEDWCDELESDDFVEMLKPRDHFKTSLISIGYSVYNLVEEILYPVLIISKADLNTKDTFAAIKDHLENNTLILDFYGYIINDDRASTSDLLFTQYQPTGTKDPALYCSTFGEKKVMGTHPKMAILDDIEERMLSAAYMYQAKILLDKSLIGGLPKGSKLILVGTIKGWDHTNDIYLYAKAKGIFSYYESPASYKVDRITRQPILEDGEIVYGLPDMSEVVWRKELKPQFHPDGTPILTHKGRPKRKWEFVVEFPTGADQDWQPIFPERYTIADLVLKRIAMREVDSESDDTFWSEFYLRPMRPGGNFFKKHRVGVWPPPGFATTETFVSFIKEFKSDWKPVCWIDPGGKKSHGIAMAILIFHGGKTYVLQMKVCKNGIPAAAVILYDWIWQYNLRVIACESNFAQKETFVDAINRELWHYMHLAGKKATNVIVQAVPNKEDKILRIQNNIAVLLGLEGTDLIFYVNTDAENYDQWCQEFGMFPKLPPGVSFEWDLLDCVSSAYIHLSSIGVYGNTCDALVGYS